MATITHRFTPCLWFDGQAEDAVNFYTGIFERSRVLETRRYGKEAAAASGQPEGTVMTVAFELDGQPFLALNGGPLFRFTPAVSFVVNCDSQREVDHYWERLGEGGDPASQQCGWLTDRFGLSWQVVPTVLPELLGDPERAPRVMAALMQMKKLDIAALENA